MISVIIPTYNEESNIKNLICQVKQLKIPIQIIVADGGSSDKTLDIVKYNDVLLVKSDKGRAKQMNEGVKKATGNFLLFLHADTILPLGFESELVIFIKEEVNAANFRLQFDSTSNFLKANAFFSRFKNNCFQYGDQALWIRKELFLELKGFNEEFPILEDNDIIQRIKKRVHFCKSKLTITTSARTYKQKGVVKLQFTYYLVYCLYSFGFSPKKLKKYFL